MWVLIKSVVVKLLVLEVIGISVIFFINCDEGIVEGDFVLL